MMTWTFPALMNPWPMEDLDPLPGGSGRPTMEVSDPTYFRKNGFWDILLSCFGTWTLWVGYALALCFG